MRLSSNGLGVGDISFGTALQMPPVMRDGRVFFFQRFAIDAFAPVGKFDRAIAINQSTGFWSVAPHWAFTVQPTDKWEISGRVNYLYNFRSNRAGGVPPIPGFQFRNGQAGDALWVNFASSVKVTEQLRLGIKRVLSAAAKGQPHQWRARAGQQAQAILCGARVVLGLQ